MKLNLGSNTRVIEGFLNVDIRNTDHVDIVEDASKLLSIPEEEVEAIIARNILEHFAPDRTQAIVNTWVRKLKTGGTLEISVPDGELIFERYRQGIVSRPEYKDNPWLDVIHSIFGNMKLEREWHGNDAEKYMHHTLFSTGYLKFVMTKAGLSKIEPAEPCHSDNVALVGVKV